MKIPYKFLAAIAIIFLAISCAHVSNDDIMGSYKGLMKGTLQWTKINADMPDQSIDSKEASVHSIKKNDKGEYYIENTKGAAIKLSKLTLCDSGITFSIPQQKMQGKGADSIYKSDLFGLNAFTLGGTKCDGYFNSKTKSLSLSFGGTLVVPADTITYTVPFVTSYNGFVKQGN